MRFYFWPSMSTCLRFCIKHKVSAACIRLWDIGQYQKINGVDDLKALVNACKPEYFVFYRFMVILNDYNFS